MILCEAQLVTKFGVVLESIPSQRFFLLLVNLFIGTFASDLNLKKKIPIGVSLFLLEKEVFNCPSRTARLCEALWSYAHKSHSDFRYISFYFIISWKL